MVIKMLKELTDNYKELSENYNSVKKEIETIKKSQGEMQNIIWNKKNTPEGIKSRLDEAEDEIRELEDNMKRNNICIIGIPEGEEDQRIENLFEKVMIENFLN